MRSVSSEQLLGGAGRLGCGGVTTRRIALFATLVCAVSAQAQSPLSIAELLSNPTQYDGRPVQVYGYVSFRFEGHEIRSKDGKLWLDLFRQPLTQESAETDWQRIDAWSELEGRCVLVGGVFRKGGEYGAGHLGQWPAEIGEVSSIRGADPARCQEK